MNATTNKYVIGLDYGSDSARAIVVDALTGETIASSVRKYPRWSQGLYCNPQINQWRQHPKDYLEVLEFIVTDALSQCPEGTARQVVGLAFDTTGSTPAFTDESGTPLSLLPEFAENPDAMFVLWKDHTAIREAQEINTACSKSKINYSKYEGGIYDAEWFWAKALHCLRQSPEVAEKAYSFVECCEWLPAVLTGVTHARNIIRSRCTAGHKALWSEEWGGLPNEEFLSGIDPLLKGWRDRLFQQTVTADIPRGTLCPEWAGRLGLSTDVIVAGSALDAHVGAVGAGVSPHTLVRVIGTSTCDMTVASYEDMKGKCIPGICGQADGSMIPGMIGLEAGQCAFGDVYAMFRRILEYPLREIMPTALKGKLSDDEIQESIESACDGILLSLTAEAEQIPIDQSTMLATDWVNGRRSPDVNPSVTGTIAGFTLGTTAPLIFRALVEATAFGSKAIMNRYEEQGIRIDNVIGIGGIALKSPFVMQTMCDVLGKPIKVCKTDQACALGAAMFAATAAGIYKKVEDAYKAMNSGFAKEYTPNPDNTKLYANRFARYIKLGKFTENEL